MNFEVREYEDEDGKSAFGTWFDQLDPRAAARVAVSLRRLEQGNDSNLQSVGGGVHELKVRFGPGYRVYLGRDGDSLIVLLGGGSKDRQQRDIDDAKRRWKACRRRKKESLAGHAADTKLRRDPT